MLHKPWKAFLFAFVIWLVGFIWGSIVFMTPALKSVSSIPYVSGNPAVSFPILVIWVVVTYLLAKSYLKASEGRIGEGLRLGIAFSAVNLLLDLLILVLLLHAGFGYFISLTVWSGYVLLFAIPWLTGRSLQQEHSA